MPNLAGHLHTERKTLAAELKRLSDVQWPTRSECADWTVWDVLAHMVATSRMSGAKFLPKLAAAGFNFEKLQAKGNRAEPRCLARRADEHLPRADRRQGPAAPAAHDEPDHHGKQRVAGLHLKATDTEWEHGSGPTVDGPILPLLLAITGRQSGLADLSGDGVETRRGR
jgi:hypothetical protein